MTDKKKTILILVISISIALLLIVALFLYIFLPRAIPNGTYTFHNITFGSSVVDKNDTLETIKEKILLEFPDNDWDTPLYGKTRLDLEAEGVLGLRTSIDFIKISGNRFKAEGDRISHDETSSKMYRLNNGQIEIFKFTVRGPMLRKTWAGLRYDSNKKVIYYETELRLEDSAPQYKVILKK
ncbi:MAG: hypothetical protein FWD89_00895 [Firmicutes bacterium]|nr:hypothetical protein [Bacillota bacterium]MCL2770851.1 hypothetical protein [Bacillota bacterium]